MTTALAPAPDRSIIAQVGELYITSTGIIAPAVMPTFEDLFQAEKLSFRMKTTAQWVLVDLATLTALEEGYEAVLDYYAPEYVRNLRYIGTNWPQETRWPDVSFSFHQVLTPLRVAARRFKAAGDEESATWTEELCATWMYDAIQNGWTRDELERQYRSYSLPPSMREEDEVLSSNGDEPLQLVIEPFKTVYTLPEVRKAVMTLVEWAERNDAPQDLIDRVREMLGISEIGE